MVAQLAPADRAKRAAMVDLRPLLQPPAHARKRARGEFRAMVAEVGERIEGGLAVARMAERSRELACRHTQRLRLLEAGRKQAHEGAPALHGAPELVHRHGVV